MAIVLNGTLNNLPASQLPSGYTPPTVTTIADYHYRYDTIIPLTWSTIVTTTNPVTSMTAIVSGVNSAVTTILSADYLSTATVTAYSVINGLDVNINTVDPTHLSTTNGVPRFEVSVTIFVKSV